MVDLKLGEDRNSFSATKLNFRMNRVWKLTCLIETRSGVGLSQKVANEVERRDRVLFVRWSVG